jgi:hypothetical protein
VASLCAGFELAHEVVHLLAPVGESNQIDEGVPVLFSDAMAQVCGSTCRSYGAAYLHAAGLVQKLLDLYPAGIPMSATTITRPAPMRCFSLISRTSTHRAARNPSSRL